MQNDAFVKFKDEMARRGLRIYAAAAVNLNILTARCGVFQDSIPVL